MFKQLPPQIIWGNRLQKENKVWVSYGDEGLPGMQNLGMGYWYGLTGDLQEKTWDCTGKPQGLQIVHILCRQNELCINCESYEKL